MRFNVLVLLIFLGCSPPTITSNCDKSANFNEYKTFSFAGVNPERLIKRPDYDNASNREIINKAIRRELRSLGYEEVDMQGDLIVQYDIIITEKIDPRIDSAQVYKPWIAAQTDTFNYTEGLLVIRLIDYEKDKLVWQGSLSGILDRKPGTFGHKLDKYVTELFSALVEGMQ